jgi:hypothetical protein
MEPTLPSLETIQEIESRQDEVLRRLDELERRIVQTLAQFGDQRFIKTAEFVAPFTEPMAKAA